MNPAAAGALAIFLLGVIAGSIVRWGLGPASQAVDERLAELDLDEPVPYLPVSPEEQAERVAHQDKIARADFTLWTIENGWAVSS